MDNTNTPTPTTRSRRRPVVQLMCTAAVSAVIALNLIGLAALQLGWTPSVVLTRLHVAADTHR
jgi:hypothetical protein